MKLPLSINHKYGGVDAEGTLMIPFTNHPGSAAHQNELADMTEIIRLVNTHSEHVSLLRQAAKCIDGAVRIEQYSHDEPPCPVSEWDYEAYGLVGEINAAIKGFPEETKATVEDL